MRKLLTLTLLVFLSHLQAQTQFWQDQFDAGSPTSGTRTPENNSGTGGPPFTAYFCSTPATSAVSQAVAFTGFSGNYWAGEDHDTPFGLGNEEQQIEWTGINISGKTGLSFRGFFAANHTSGPWDNGTGSGGSDPMGPAGSNDYIILEYRIDGGAYTQLFLFIGDNDGTGFPFKSLREDTNGDGDGDGTQLQNVFGEFIKTIPGTGTTLDIRLRARSNGLNEEWGIENFRMFESLPSSEINVQGNSTTIVDGDATPSLTDHTDFGSQSVCSGTIARTYTIQNSGTSNLTISSVNISGTHAADFSVTANPAGTVAAAGSTTFQVTFNPSATGLRNATITINNNDVDEAAYDFAIQGTGIDPEINMQGNSITIADGDITPSFPDHTDFGSQNVCSGNIVRTYTIQNTGTSNLSIGAGAITVTGTNAADFTVGGITLPTTVVPSGSISFTVTLDPSATGIRLATLNIASNDCDEATYDFAMQGTGIDPEVNVQGNSTTIADGDATPSLTDHTDFGSQSVCSGTIVRIFTIQNTGTANLTLANPTISGTHAADYSITANPSSPLAAAGSTTFQVTFNPSATGLRTATISFTNNDCDEATYDFAIQGTGTDPEINIQGNSTSITDGDATPSLTDHTDFGSQPVCSGTIVRTFTIQNTGNNNLTIGAGAITLTGPNAADYSIGGITLPTTIAGSGTTTFTVTFDPSASGIRAATVNIVNNDCDETNYDFAIQGNGADPEINITGNGNNILDGQTTPSGSNHTGFGPVQVCSGSVIRTYTIQNTGATTLTISSVSITGPNASDFTVSAAPPTTIASGTSAAFQVTFDPTASGSRQATINVFNDDCDESTYDYAIQGTGNADVTPPTVLCQNATIYLDASGNASITPSMIDNGSSDFCGIASVSVSPNTFTCANVGVNPVTLTVTDNSGNNTTCIANVTVMDTIDPLVACQNISVYLDLTGNASITGAMINNGSSDACGIATLVASPSTFTCANIGANTITLTVTDNNGNISTCTSTITVIDTIAPTAVCQNPTLNLNVAGTLNIGAIDIDNGSNDACGLFSLSASPNSFTCANVGANNVMLTVTDDHGNVSTCTSIVTVVDITPPIIISQNLTVYLDTLGNTSITGFMLNNGSTDACGIATYSVSPDTYSCANVGPNTVTLTVTDVNGNASTGTCTVSVMDTIAPEAYCQNISVTLDASGNATITGTMIDNGSTDECGIGSVNVSPSAFTCANIGANSVLLTVTDNNGNISTCSSIVTINQPAPANQSFTICSGQSIVIGLNTYNSTGIYTDSLTNINGCDSILITNLTVTLPQTSSQNVNICAGDSYTIGSSIYSITGTYTDTLSNITGCDSIITTNLTVAPIIDLSTLVSGITISANAFATSYQWIDCNNGNNAIVGETAQSYTATANGDYAVIITINSCSDTSDCVSINNVGLENNIELSQLELYPNPSDGMIQISIQNLKCDWMLIDVMDVKGSILRNWKYDQINDSFVQIYNMEDLRAGMYILRIQTNLGSKYHQFIIK